MSHLTIINKEEFVTLLVIIMFNRNYYHNYTNNYIHTFTYFLKNQF